MQHRVLRRCCRVALIGLVAVLSVASCTGERDATIDVFAAASLTDAFAEVAEAFEQRDGTTVRLTLAGSSTLREQLRDGAPADVFVSANDAVMAQLLDSGDVEAVPAVAATNELVLAVPAGNPANVSELADLARDELLVGVCASGVPCGDLAAAWFAAAGVEPSTDTAESDVRSLAGRLAEAELDAALVYATDVVASAGRIETVVVAGPSTTYPIIVVEPDGQPFVDFVLSADGQAILEAWGFGRP